MKKAGCWEISFGLESGSDELLKKMDKAAAVDKSREVLDWTAKAGIRSKGLFMLGYPGETEETIATTKAFVKSVPLTIMNLTKFTPYPGSPIYRDIYGTNIRDDHWQKMNGMNFLWAPEGMTIDQLNSHYKSVLMSFYSQAKIPWYYTKLTLATPFPLIQTAALFLGDVEGKTETIARQEGRSGPIRPNWIRLKNHSFELQNNVNIRSTAL